MAAWAALGLGFASVIGVGGFGLIQQGAYQQEAQDKAADYAKHAARQIQQTCIRYPAPEQAQCVANEQAEYELKARDNRREHDDLVAQRKSALWTFVMGLAALIGMALSAIGVFLVKRTFDETRRTNRIAMRENARATRRAVASAKDTEAALAIAARNADAAAAQVKVAQDIGEAQARAYLTISSVWIKRAGEWLWLVPKFKNYGQSPARNLKVRYYLHLLETASSTTTALDSEWVDWNEIVPAGDEYEGTGWHSPDRLTPTQIDAWDRTKKLMIGLRVEAQAIDVFGKPIKAVAGFTALPEDWEEGEFHSMGRASTLGAAIKGEVAKRKDKGK